MCVCLVHSQEVSSIHSMCAGGYSLKYPKTSCVLMSSTPVTWIASRRSLGMAEHRRRRSRQVNKHHQHKQDLVIDPAASCHLSSSCLYLKKHCAVRRSPHHRNGNASLASLSSRLPPDKHTHTHPVFCTYIYTYWSTTLSVTTPDP